MEDSSTSSKLHRALGIRESMVKIQDSEFSTKKGLLQQLWRWRSSRPVALILCACVLLSPVSCQSTPATNISAGFTLSVGGTTLLSPGRVFEVGFTNGTQMGASSPNVYALAIWYAQTAPQKTVVWVASRSMAVSSQATLNLSVQGELQVSDVGAGGQISVVWTSKTANVSIPHAIDLTTIPRKSDSVYTSSCGEFDKSMCKSLSTQVSL